MSEADEIRKQSAEQLSIMREAGIKRIEWRAHAICPQRCQNRDGRQFSIQGESAWPKLDGAPPLDENCRCVMLPVV